MAKRKAKKGTDMVVQGPSSTDVEWRARSDADTMKQAEMIRMDKGRHKRAMAFMKQESKACDAVLSKAGFSFGKGK